MNKFWYIRMLDYACMKNNKQKIKTLLYAKAWINLRNRRLSSKSQLQTNLQSMIVIIQKTYKREHYYCILCRDTNAQ